MRIVSVDLETCGVSEECDIIEFGAVLDDLSVEIKDFDDLSKLPRFHTYFVKDKYVGEPFALSMHKEIFLRIAEKDRSKYRFMTATKFGYEFRKFLVQHGYEEEHDKVVINVAGKNFASFDLQFLKNKTDFLTHINVRSRILDPAILYLDQGDNALPGTATCKKRANMSEELTHTSIADAIDVIWLLRKRMRFMVCPDIYR